MKIPLIISLLLSSCCCVAQHFSGEIHYTTRLTQGTDHQVNLDSLSKMQPGTESLYLITDGYYKTTYFRAGEETYSYTYHGDTKLMYDDEPSKTYVTYRDSRKGDGSAPISTVFRDSIQTILGYKCFLVITSYEGFTLKSYYAEQIRVNPDSFKGHEVGNWYNDLLNTNGGLPLRTISEYQGYTKVDEAVKVIPRRVSKEEFRIPKGKPVVASYSVLDKNAEMTAPDKVTTDCYEDKFAAASSPFGKTKTLTVYVRFVLSEKGEIRNVSAYEEDDFGMHKIAEDIINSCGLKFTPGQINGKAVTSEVYFPVSFEL